MKRQLTIPAMAVVLFAAILVLGGCYTQVGALRSDDEYGYDDATEYADPGEAEDYTEAEDYYDYSYPSPNYFVTFSYYHPGSYYSFGWCDPWYWYPGATVCGPYYASYWYWSPYYGWCPPYYSYYYSPHPYGYYGYYSPGYSYASSGGGVGSFRDFGNTRGITSRTGGTRRTGGSPILRSGQTDGNSGTLPVASVSRPVSGRKTTDPAVDRSGKSEEASQPRGTVTRKRIVPPRYTPPKTGVSSTPPRSSGTRVGRSTPSRTPAPAPAPPPGGNRSTGSSRSGGSRGGGDR